MFVEFSAVNMHLNTQDNIILIIKNKHLFNHLVWLGVSRVIIKNHQILRFSGREWSPFDF